MLSPNALVSGLSVGRVGKMRHDSGEPTRDAGERLRVDPIDCVHLRVIPPVPKNRGIGAQIAEDSVHSDRPNIRRSTRSIDRRRTGLRFSCRHNETVCVLNPSHPTQVT